MREDTEKHERNILKVGGNTLGTWSKTQATLALSSGEAEFVALHKGALEGLAARSLSNETPMQSQPVLKAARSSTNGHLIYLVHIVGFVSVAKRKTDVKWFSIHCCSPSVRHSNRASRDLKKPLL